MFHSVLRCEYIRIKYFAKLHPPTIILEVSVRSLLLISKYVVNSNTVRNGNILVSLSAIVHTNK